ncbi:MAG: TonB-dependent receptor-like protein, partial [Sphingomonas bacterium]|nr:TonB-dependent receptor-like protein [Sphingomonas bacterium]
MLNQTPCPRPVHDRRTAHMASRAALAVVLAFAATGTATAQATPEANAAAASQEGAKDSVVTEAQPALPSAGADNPGAVDRTNDDIVVTGSRITRSGFETPTPVQVVGAERLEKLGLTNVGDALNQVPAFRPGITPTTSGITFGTIGSRLADLRGLGPTRTLLLLNGRRFVASTAQSTVDLNNIPSILLQRSEVVTGGASAAYGSDAVAGVVNLIMDDKFTGIKANAEYGVSKYGDGQDYQGGLAFGTGFGDGRGHIVIGGEYQDSKAVGDCYTRPWCATEAQELTNSAPGVNGAPARFLARDVHTSTQTRGGLITAGPLRGIQFSADGTPATFTNGQFAGNLFMIGGSGHGENAFISGVYIRVPVERYTGYAHGTWDFSDSVTGFFEANYGYVDGKALGGARRDTGSLTIRIDNPFLPASIVNAMRANNITTFRFGRESTDLGFALGRDRTRTYRGVAGLDGKLGGSWSWNAYYQFGRSNYKETVDQNPIEGNFNLALDAVAGPNGVPICRSTRTNPNNGCAPINLFGQNRFSAEARDYVLGEQFQTRRLTQHVLSGNIQGEPFSTWAGPVSVAAGVEYRTDKVVGTTDPVSQALGFTRSNGTALNGQIKVTEGYFETIVPLAKDWVLARSLELNGAIRRTHYSTSGNVTTWKVGAVYEPIDGVRFRATRSRDIRAPNLAENFNPETATQATINDSATANQGVFPVRSGGSTDLAPEKANTFTGGVVLQPGGFLEGLRLSVDYYNIEIKGAIASLAPQTIVTQCNIGNTVFCPLVTRGNDRFITLIRTPFLNLNTVKTDGVDIQAQYSLPLSRLSSSLPDGNFDFTASATYVAHLKTIQATGSTDIAGVTGCSVTSFFSCLPHWTLDSVATYTQGRFSISYHSHFIPKSVYDPTLVGPEDAGYNPALPNSININRVDARYYAALSAQFNI